MLRKCLGYFTEFFLADEMTSATSLRVLPEKKNRVFLELPLRFVASTYPSIIKALCCCYGWKLIL